jgi:acetylornithine/succinyldiaminopimelate/putrescine aminotransferase
MGGGLPIGAFISSSEIMQVLTNNPILGHITTFGGHPLSCVASHATLKVIQDENLVKDVEAKGQLFRSLLKHPTIKEIRGIGLMLAVEFESFEILKPIIDEGIEMGILTDWFLFDNKSMRIVPPINITEAQIQQACDIILASIRKFHS